MADYTEKDFEEARKLFQNDAWIAGGIIGLIPYVATALAAAREEGLEMAAVILDNDEAHSRQLGELGDALHAKALAARIRSLKPSTKEPGNANH